MLRGIDDWERHDHRGRFRRSVVVITTRHTDKAPWPWRIRSVKQTRASDGWKLFKDNCNASVVEMRHGSRHRIDLRMRVRSGRCAASRVSLAMKSCFGNVSRPLVHVDLFMYNSEMRRQTGGNQPLFSFLAPHQFFNNHALSFFFSKYFRSLFKGY